MKVVEFRIIESKINKGMFILVAKTEEGKEFVVSGNHHHPTYLEPLETSWDNQINNESHG